ncbi:MAG: hypothetical protein ACI4OJ_06375 [Lachnospiraceae bacterium]
MEWFEKKVVVYSAKGRKEEWKKLKRAMKMSGVTGITSDVWMDEPQPAGCGAHLDVRDFGPNGKIDRDIYTIYVPRDQQEQALQVLNALCPDYEPYTPDPNRPKLY